MNLDPLKPYADLIRWLAIIAMVAIFGMGMRSCGKESMQDKNYELRRQLLGASQSLTAASDALRQQDEANQKRVKDAIDAERHAVIARKVSKAEAERLEKMLAERSDEFRRKLLIAQRRPKCEEWLDTNVMQVCGI